MPIATAPLRGFPLGNFDDLCEFCVNGFAARTAARVVPELDARALGALCAEHVALRAQLALFAEYAAERVRFAAN